MGIQGKNIQRAKAEIERIIGQVSNLTTLGNVISKTEKYTELKIPEENRINEAITRNFGKQMTKKK